MKMSDLEKVFVNSVGHSQSVGRYAERWVRLIPIEPGWRYLDVGTGNGLAAIHIAKTFDLDVTGVDVDPAQIRLAEASGAGLNNVHFLTADATHLPFEDGEFDLVFTNKVTHHIPNWETAFAEMARVLKPGGYLIYSDLAFPTPIARLGQAIAGGHGGFPTRKALGMLIERYGLSIVKASRSPAHFAHFEGAFRKSG